MALYGSAGVTASASLHLSQRASCSSSLRLSMLPTCLWLRSLPGVCLAPLCGSEVSLFVGTLCRGDEPPVWALPATYLCYRVFAKMGYPWDGNSLGAWGDANVTLPLGYVLENRPALALNIHRWKSMSQPNGWRHPRRHCQDQADPAFQQSTLTRLASVLQGQICCCCLWNLTLYIYIYILPGTTKAWGSKSIVQLFAFLFKHLSP